MARYQRLERVAQEYDLNLRTLRNACLVGKVKASKVSRLWFISTAVERIKRKYEPYRGIAIADDILLVVQEYQRLASKQQTNNKEESHDGGC